MRILGIDAPMVQDKTQNGFHKYISGSPYFPRNTYAPRFYFDYQNLNSFSLYRY